VPGVIRVHGDAGVVVRGVRHDSRFVEPGDLFVVRRGQAHDGRAFVPQAIARGASALMMQTACVDGAVRDAFVPVPDSVPAIEVQSVAQALGHAASAVYGAPSHALSVIGITGTNGKTTSAHLVRAAVNGALQGEHCGVIGTVGCVFAGQSIGQSSHTTPEADELARVLAVMRRRGATHAVMEVSSIALELGRLEATRFRVAAFTNLTQDHLDFHGSMHAYGEAKARLFTECKPEYAVINVDDAFGEGLAKRAQCNVLRVRARVGSGDGDVVPLEAHLDGAGMRIRARVLGCEVQLCSRLLGAHNLENMMVALGVASALGLDVPSAAHAIATEPGAPGRLERCDREGDDVTVLVDYAHTPDALARVLDAVSYIVKSDGNAHVFASAASSQHGDGFSNATGAGASPSSKTSRLWCVFGCGGDRDRAKRLFMGQAAAERSDVVIVTSDNPRSESPDAIAAAVEEGLVSAGSTRVDPKGVSSIDASRIYLVELRRSEAIALAIASAKPGDVVIIAGKGHEDYQIINNVRFAFDDRAEARRALDARRHRAFESP